MNDTLRTFGLATKPEDLPAYADNEIVLYVRFRADPNMPAGLSDDELRKSALIGWDGAVADLRDYYEKAVVDFVFSQNGRRLPPPDEDAT